ncbi:hypothetical protein [Candidatus Thiodiazotropha endoloripes]|uniref:Uncharacterized protein n=1 Tax=Candidatus Thiodiazotropha endoloripes TaxID=1818881 RepID=A0A1E2UTX6_9GAMM|nr:hypothetical protein [Candidatus Thiodiazotropha endoloripes]MCG7983767.1 hypothetical protein [Candidatus Thiodiazotropha lotti]ODB98022.1 hypothetical protein A3196_15400 [Candidatus Thiodiazotropha endoloripes]
MEIIVNPYKDSGRGVDWDEQTPKIISEMNLYFSQNKETLNFSLLETDHGTSADWPTITITIGGGIGALFIIPEAHKRIRESFEEWKRIGNEITSLITWIASKYPVVAYPKELLFFDLLEWFETELGIDVNELEFISVDDEFPIPDKRYGMSIDKAYLFTLKNKKVVYQIAIQNDREIIWKHSYEI